MKRFLLVIPAWLLMAAALCFVIVKKRAETMPSGNPERAPAAPPSSATRLDTGRPPESTGDPKLPSSRAQSGTSRPNRTEDVLQEIESQVITYSTDGVAPIAAHLLDSDPVVRDSARRGLRQLGEAAAIPFLRRAAVQLDDTESKACLDAAAFLELPSWSGTEEARAFSEKLSESTQEP